MQLLLEFIPIVFFVVAYLMTKDIYFATGVLMVAMPVFFAIQWLITRKINKIYAGSTALLLIAGSITLLTKNPVFLFWKPTVMYWATALVFLGSHWIGDKTIVQRMFANSVEMTPVQWKTMSQMWIGFMLFIGAVNIFVAYTYGQDIWVKFKIPGLMGLMILFIVLQSVWMMFIAGAVETTAKEPEE